MADISFGEAYLDVYLRSHGLKSDQVAKTFLEIAEAYEGIEDGTRTDQFDPEQDSPSELNENSLALLYAKRAWEIYRDIQDPSDNHKKACEFLAKRPDELLQKIGLRREDLVCQSVEVAVAKIY